VHAAAIKQRLEDERKERDLHGNLVNMYEDISTERQTAEAASDHIRALTGQQLWVEKYAPKSFAQLLSGEKTNREVGPGGSHPISVD
jgi:hypothetical protein